MSEVPFLARFYWLSATCTDDRTGLDVGAPSLALCLVGGSVPARRRRASSARAPTSAGGAEAPVARGAAVSARHRTTSSALRAGARRVARRAPAGEPTDSTSSARAPARPDRTTCHPSPWEARRPEPLPVRAWIRARSAPLRAEVIHSGAVPQERDSGVSEPGGPSVAVRPLPERTVRSARSVRRVASTLLVGQRVALVAVVGFGKEPRAATPARNEGPGPAAEER